MFTFPYVGFSLSKLDIKNAFSYYIVSYKWYNLKKIRIDPFKGPSLKIEAVSASYISPLCFLNNIHVKLAIHFYLEEKIVKNYVYLSKLAAQMVTSTPSENLSLHPYETQYKNFNFGTLKTLILHARSIFFKGGHPTKIWRKKIFFMKTLSKLGALMVHS